MSAVSASSHDRNMTTTDTTAGEFFVAPPMAGPALEWRPEYGTIDDEGETIDLGGGVYVYSSPDYTLDVNTLYVTTSDGVVVVDSQPAMTQSRVSPWRAAPPSWRGATGSARRSPLH